MDRVRREKDRREVDVDIGRSSRVKRKGEV